MAVVGILIFRESYPYFLDPNYMSTTLVTLSKYIQPNMYVVVDLIGRSTRVRPYRPPTISPPLNDRYDDLAANTHLPKELKDKIPDSEVCRTAYHVRPCDPCELIHQRLTWKHPRHHTYHLPLSHYHIHTQKSVQVNLAFLAVQYGVLALALLISFMCGYAWWNRPRRGGPRVYLQ